MSLAVRRYSAAEVALIREQQQIDAAKQRCSSSSSPYRRTSSNKRATVENFVQRNMREVRQLSRENHQRALAERARLRKSDAADPLAGSSSTRQKDDLAPQQCNAYRRVPGTGLRQLAKPRRVLQPPNPPAKPEYVDPMIGMIPPYLIARHEEQANARLAKEQQQAVREAERQFPNGKQPLQPEVAEASREVLEALVARLRRQWATFPFEMECSLVGKQRKAKLEMELRNAEEALQQFQYPVIYVPASRPKLVVNRKK
jgi:hypothetical protein